MLSTVTLVYRQLGFNDGYYNPGFQSQILPTQ
jgi:hypothetical protein